MSDQEPEVIENAEGDAQVCPSTQSPPAPQPEAETAEEYDPTHPEPDATSPKAENHSRDNDAFSILHPEVKAQLDALIAENLLDTSAIDDRVLPQLHALSPSDGIESLSKLANAIRTSTVRNPSAYLAGVIRRIGTEPHSRKQSADQHNIAGTISDLVWEAQNVLQGLYSEGLVRRGDLDGKCLRSLASKPPDVQILVMETFRERNLTGIRNMAAFFTSHLTMVERDIRDRKLTPGVRRPHNPPPHLQYGAHPSVIQRYEDSQRQQHQQHQQHQQPPHPQYAPPQQYGAPPPQQYGAPLPQQYGAPPPQQAYAPPPAMQPLPAAAYRADHGSEQLQWGVRIAEFHSLSPHARFVAPAAALRLQQLWDSGNRLVSLLDNSSWDMLASLESSNATAAVDETAVNMASAPDDIPSVNAIFMMAARRYPPRAVGGVPPALPYGVPAVGAPMQQAAPYGAPAAIPYQQPSSYLPQMPQSLQALPVNVQQQIKHIVDRSNGMIKFDHFAESKASSMLLRMGDTQALKALDEFGNNDPKNMRNVTAYLIGCIKKYDPQAGQYTSHDASGGRGASRGGGRAAGGGRGGGRGEGSRYQPY